MKNRNFIIINAAICVMNLAFLVMAFHAHKPWEAMAPAAGLSIGLIAIFGLITSANMFEEARKESDRAIDAYEKILAIQRARNCASVSAAVAEEERKKWQN